MLIFDMRNIILLLCTSLLITFSSCEEVIIIDVEQTPSQLVIDALVTNVDTTHMVRITRSIDFYSSGVVNVEDGIVSVTDNFGNTYNYTHNPEGYDSLNGYYFSDQRFTGQVNGIYQLNVTVNSVNYTASDTLKPVTTIDSLSIAIDEHAVDNPDHEEGDYQVILYAKEPQETLDFYYFKFYRDGTLEVDNNVFVFEDRLLGNSLDGLPSPVYFAEGELATVELYSLTRVQYIYFSDLANILNNDGGMFSPPPANPRSNISGGALGLFQVSGVSRRSILIVP